MSQILVGEVVLEARAVTKHFPGVLALDGVNFALKKGEIHALLGENGSGKTTLASIFYGMLRPDSGEVLVDSSRTAFHSPAAALKHGIALVNQHFTLIRTLTAAENIVLGNEPSNDLVIDYGAMKDRVKELSQRWGLQVRVDSKVWQLSVGERERVEILRALYVNPSVLILDEPTAVLTPLEVDSLFQSMRLFAKEGKSVIFISHKLDEVTEIADTVTVLGRGRVLGTFPVGEVTKQALARLMVGRDVIFEVRKDAHEVGRTVLRVSDLRAKSDERLPALNGVSFEIREGEVVGLAGVAGNGQKELAQVLIGVRRAEGGRILLDDTDITNLSTEQVRAQGVSYIPEDRESQGIVKDMTLYENILMRVPRTKELASSLFIKKGAVKELCKGLLQEYDIRAPSIGVEAKTLSGGNAQKLIVAREVSTRPRLLIAVEPTRGLDIGATENVHNILLKQRSEGTSILLISSDLDEVFDLSDRVVVLAKGEIQGTLGSGAVDHTQLGLMMAGSKPTNEAV